MKGSPIIVHTIICSNTNSIDTITPAAKSSIPLIIPKVLISCKSNLPHVTASVTATALPAFFIEST